jgi:hypothetical protein
MTPPLQLSLACLALALCFVACGDDGGMGDPDGSTECGGACDDGLFCNGPETCDPVTGCVAGSPPCGTEMCDEDTDRCASECGVDADMDGDGEESVMCGGDDCDDSDDGVFPGATEICDPDGVDEDCNPLTVGTLDNDGDGVVSSACCNGDECGPDCDDGNGNVAPGQTEACNGTDDDCDGSVDEGALTTYYVDADGDDFGDPSETMMACSQPSGYSENDRDCDDSLAAANPGAAEVCDASGDNDCNPDTESPFDEDGDGFDDASCGGNDPNDQQETVFPGAPEVCDGYDSNDDGAEDVPDCQSCTGTCTGDCRLGTCDTPQPDGTCDGTCTGSCVGSCDGTCGPGSGVVSRPGEDQDEDGFLSTSTTCSGGPRDGLPRTDCNDYDATFHPTAPEACNGFDNDCDGTVDDGLTDTTTTPVPNDALGLLGGGAPDGSCLGSGSRPAPGADTMTTVSFVDLMNNPVEATLEVWSQGVEPVAGGCVASSDCTEVAVDVTGTQAIPHRENEVITIVEPDSGAVTRFSPTDTTNVHLPSGNPDVAFGSFYFQGRDCVDAPLNDQVHLRIYRPSTGVCSELPLLSGGAVGLAGERIFGVSGFSPALASGGETVVVELWGRIGTGAFEVLARESAFVHPSYRAFQILGPLRSDSPPVP